MSGSIYLSIESTTLCIHQMLQYQLLSPTDQQQCTDLTTRYKKNGRLENFHSSPKKDSEDFFVKIICTSRFYNRDINENQKDLLPHSNISRDTYAYYTDLYRRTKFYSVRNPMEKKL